MKVIYVLIYSLLFASLVYATQDKTGSIEGVIIDSRTHQHDAPDKTVH